MQSFLNSFTKTFLFLILFFVVIVVYLGIKNYNNTWTIEGGNFKAIYDDYDECKMNNYGTGTTDICDDKKQVKYKNGNDSNE